MYEPDSDPRSQKRALDPQNCNLSWLCAIMWVLGAEHGSWKEQ